MCFIYLFIYLLLLSFIFYYLFKWFCSDYIRIDNKCHDICSNNSETFKIGRNHGYMIIQTGGSDQPPNPRSFLIRVFHHENTSIYFYPLKPHSYIVKLEFTGVYIICLISAPNIDCVFSLEPPRWGGSNDCPQSMFGAEIWKISEFFLSENFQFLEVKLSIYLNRRVFVMVF